MKILRVIAGLALAPFIGLVLFVIVASLLNPKGESMLLFALACFVAYSIALVLGVPAIVAFHLLKFSRWWQYCLAGAVIGVVGILLVTFQPHDWPRINNEPRQLFASALLGAVSALVFWLIAVYQSRQAHAA
jgi:MFS family permease